MGKGKGSGSGRPRTEKPKRISGTGYDIATQAGAAGIAHLKYKAERAGQKGIYDIDIQQISQKIRDYIDNNDVYSRVGLRIALGISRETYNTWLKGYVDSAHMSSDEYICNVALSDAVRAGDDMIIKQLVETCDKYGDSKRIELLRTYGEIAGKGETSKPVQIYSLGQLKIYGQ